MPRERGKCRAILLGSPIGNCSKGLFLLHCAPAIFLGGVSARRRPRKGGGSSLRWRGTGFPNALRRRDPFFTVARGPVPRERSVDRSMARDRPSPYGEGGCSVKKMSRYRSAGALGCHTRIREGFPRARWSARTMARDRVSQRLTEKGRFLSCAPFTERISNPSA